jgi:hypothetical protein
LRSQVASKLLTLITVLPLFTELPRRGLLGN